MTLMLTRTAAMMAALGLATVMAPVASAGVIYVGSEVFSGNGFGSDPRALTIQSHGPSNTSESGCIAPDGTSGLIAGADACAPGDGVAGGDEQNPIGFPKQSAPSLSSLGIEDADQIGILFDGVQPQNSTNMTVTIDDLTLKLYSSSSLLVTASGSFTDLDTNPGNGQSDFLFKLDPASIAAFNAAIAGHYNDTLALDSTVSLPRQSAGPDSYSLINMTGISGSGGEGPSGTPEPATAALFGGAMLALAAWRYTRP